MCHARTSPAPVDPKRFDPLAPDSIGEHRRDMNHVHERTEFAPVLRRMRSPAFWRKKLVLGDIEPIQDGRFNNRAGSSVPQSLDDVPCFGLPTCPRNSRKRSLDGGVINLHPRLRQNADR